MLAGTASLVVGGCAMGLAWGVWGVFVAVSALTVVGSTAPGLLLLPRSAVTRMLVMQVASCAMWFMLIGWGLVMLLYPEYTVGWRTPGKSGGGMRVEEVEDAQWIGWSVLGMGVFCAALIITVEILPSIRRARAEQ
ncbi:hypothetical protein [Microbacterium halophytorum]|uniref:hypothetical protein n=1 Tax=Microbacterium halophytorum TaxID=2067568 RepID=UPI000CFC398C|nr:hypothetical protein [Microbacterium halophytorum]